MGPDKVPENPQKTLSLPGPAALASAGAQRPAETFLYGRELPGQACDAILTTHDSVWVGTVGGLTRFSLDAAGSMRAIRSYTRANASRRSIVEAVSVRSSPGVDFANSLFRGRKNVSGE